MEQLGDKVLLRHSIASQVIPTGIFGGSMAPHNWFHWIIDTLPTLYQARFLPPEFDDFPLLVPSGALRRENWRAALDAVADGRRVIGVSDDRLVKVNNLVFLEGATRANPHSSLGAVSGRISVRKDLLIEYRDFILDHFDLSSVGAISGVRIFLARKAEDVRRYNQPEVVEMLSKHGFKPVFLEDLTFRESIRLFRSAEIIAGPHGAGLANLLFCTSKTGTLMWTWAGLLEDNWYQNIAYVSGVKYHQVETEDFPNTAAVARQDPRISDYLVDPQKLIFGLSLIGPGDKLAL
jgi:capsular polysaccharide biosynthesis protein